MTDEMAGRVVLVTGSTRGIGRGIAETFAQHGARVVVHGRDAAQAEAVAKGLPGDAVGIGLELGSKETAETLVAQASERAGDIGILVNNAAVARDRFLTRLSDDDWEGSLAVNASAPFYLMRAVVPTMKNRPGANILNVISQAGISGMPGQAAYSASKGALLALTFAGAKELGHFGIRVNALNPIAETDMSKGITPEVRAAAEAGIPLRRWGTTEEVAEGALFLCSDRARYVTGQVLHVDGGFHLA